MEEVDAQLSGVSTWQLFRRPWPVLLLIICVLVVVLVLSSLRLFEMDTNSMEPTIHGTGIDGSSMGDLVLVSKWFNMQRISRGDLVLVSYNWKGGRITTIRRILQVGGGTCPTNNFLIPSGFYYVSANSTNGIDSKVVGLFDESQIHGKELRIFHVNR